MLFLALHVSPLYNTADLLEASCAPDGAYAVIRDIECNSHIGEVTLRDFSGVILGQYYQISLTQQEPFISGLTGLVLHLRVKHTIPAAFIGAHALRGGVGGVLKHFSVDLTLGDETGALPAGTLSTFIKASRMKMTNLTLSLRLNVDSEATSVFGLEDSQFSTPIANMTVYISVRAAADVTGIARSVANLANASVRIAGSAAQSARGLICDADGLTATNITVYIQFSACAAVYTLLQSVGSAVFSSVRITVKLHSAVRVLAVGAVSGDSSSFGDFWINYDFALASADSAGNNEVHGQTGEQMSSQRISIWGLASHGSGSFDAKRIRVQFGIKTAQSITLSGLSDVHNAVQTFSQVMIAGSVVCTGNQAGSTVGGLAQIGFNGIQSNIYVNLTLSGGNDYYQLGGLFAQQYGGVTVKNAHANVTLLNFTGNGSIGAVAGTLRSSTGNQTYKNVLALLFLEQTAKSAPLSAGAFAGDATNATCESLVAYVDLRLKGAQTLAGGICGVAQNFSCMYCTVTGTLQYAGTSVDADSSLAGVVGKLILNGTFTTVSVNVNITSSMPMLCATFFAAAANSKLTGAISVGQILNCGRQGVAVPAGVSTQQVYELDSDSKNISYDGVQKTAQNAFGHLPLIGFIDVPGMWHTVVADVPHMLNATHFAGNHTERSGAFLLLCVDKQIDCVGTVSGLPNTISNLIGNISNPYGICQTPHCISDCSFHGAFKNGACECEIGYIGDVCQEKLCDFEHGVRAETETQGYCQCEPEFQYIDAKNDSGFVDACYDKNYRIPNEPTGTPSGEYRWWKAFCDGGCAK